MQILNRHLLDKGWPAGAMYIGRGTPLGNPIHINEDCDRAEAIACYGDWLRDQIRRYNPVVLTALLALNEHSSLICSCAPKPCHGNMLEQIWTEWQRGDFAGQNGADGLGPRPATLTYAGIGSRETPTRVLATMTAIARRMEANGYTLRSGAADGADSAFEAGATHKEIYLPKAGFNGSNSPLATPTPEAFEIAAHMHPYPTRLSLNGIKLMARNSHQVLGPTLRSPADCVICWTKDGIETEQARTRASGGTGQAIALASRWGIPVFNLCRPDALARLGVFVNDRKAA